MNEPQAYTQKLSGSVNIAIPKGNFIYTDTFKFGGVNDFAIIYKMSGTGLPSVKIEMQQSVDGTNWFKPASVGDIATALTSQLLQGGPLQPICVSYIRFKITDLTNMVVDTIINMSVVIQPKFGV